jgi:hypothetical protein
MFDQRWENWASDFDGSFASESLPTIVRGRTTEIIDAFVRAVLAFSPEFPEEVRPGTFAKVFGEPLQRLSFPEEVRHQVPEVIAAFLEYLQASGRAAEGEEWATEVRSLASDFVQKRRPQGAIKGQTIKRSEKVSPLGRNDPCPCGSGKKYKKCCLNSA